MGESSAVLLFVCAIAAVYLFFARPEITVIELAPPAGD
jgi:hypothetical protein